MQGRIDHVKVVLQEKITVLMRKQVRARGGAGRGGGDWRGGGGDYACF